MTTPDFLLDLQQSLPLTLSLQQVAEVLHVSTRTVKRMLAAKQLKHVKAFAGAGSRVVVPRSEVVRWMAEHAR